MTATATVSRPAARCADFVGRPPTDRDRGPGVRLAAFVGLPPAAQVTVVVRVDALVAPSWRPATNEED